ncbi:MAG: dolichyl-phosphate beta-D-mannosyltransferase [Flavobacteriales bacterium]|nr:dolichyl-phosphate beta-D-mannosyltransferase [Flavobacteriales bacterium]|tara:strand:- start:14671 stop:15396 length:726 start_codon:yes stop_codon:yes gene_type:complete
MSDTLVIIPTYNEIDNIEDILRTVFGLKKSYHVLIVDDGSPDGTADIVKKLQIEFPEQLHLEERTGKLGLGTAYIHGFKWALTKSYNYVVEMDADFSHPPTSLIELYKACEHEGADLSVGSRYVSGVNVVNWPMSRVLMSYFASVYVRWVTRISVKDTTAGFVCYHRRVLERMNLDKINFVGYAFQIEMKFTAWKLGFKIKEVPIIFTDRKKGQSKMSSSIFKEAIFGVLFMKIKSWFKKY